MVPHRDEKATTTAGWAMTVLREDRRAGSRRPRDDDRALVADGGTVALLQRGAVDVDGAADHLNPCVTSFRQRVGHAVVPVRLRSHTRERPG